MRAHESMQCAPLHACCFMLGLLLVWTCIAAASAQVPDPAQTDPRQWLRQGQSLLQQGQFDEAERALRLAITTKSRRPLNSGDRIRVLRMLTDIYLRTERFELAVQTGRQQRRELQQVASIQVQVSDPVVRNQLAAQRQDAELTLCKALEGLGEFAQAAKCIDAALEISAGNRAKDPAWELSRLIDRAELVAQSGQNETAERRWSQASEAADALAIRVGNGQIAEKHQRRSVDAISRCYRAVGRDDDATHWDRRLAQTFLARGDRIGASATLVRIADGYVEAHRSVEAQQALEEAVAALESRAGADDFVGCSSLGVVLDRLATVVADRGDTKAAEDYWRRAAEQYQRALSLIEQAASDPIQMMALLVRLQEVHKNLRDYRAALPIAERLLEIRAQYFGADSESVYASKGALGALHGELREFDRAIEDLNDVVAYWRQRSDSRPLLLAEALNNLAVVERAMGALPSAEQHAVEALELRQAHCAPDDLRLAYSHSNLASIFTAKGLWRESVTQYLAAVAVCRSNPSDGTALLSQTLLNLAMNYKSQRQFDRARQYCAEALALYTEQFGEDAAGAAAYYNALATLAVAQNQWTDALEAATKAKRTCEHNGLDRSPEAATARHYIALASYLAGRDLQRRGDSVGAERMFDRAQSDWDEARLIQAERGLLPKMARTWTYLGELAQWRRDYHRAETAYRNAVKLYEQFEGYPAVHYNALSNLAVLIVHNASDERKAQARDEALKLLRKAVALTEEPRAGTSDAEAQSARYFEQFSLAFDLIVDWSLDDGDIAGALEYAERGRNRTFLDQLRIAGVDVRETIPEEQRDRLTRRELEVSARLGTLQARRVELAVAAEATASAADERREVESELREAQADFARVWAEIRQQSSLYQLYRQTEAGREDFGSLTALRDGVLSPNMLMLRYHLGQERSHLFVIGAEAGDEQWLELTISDEVARLLSQGAATPIEPGPLTRDVATTLVTEYLASIGVDRSRAGSVRGLRPDTPIAVRPELNLRAESALSRVLLPEAVRAEVNRRAIDYIVLVPDGALHELPFEALLLNDDPRPQYVLDAFPPIAYAPSATVLAGLVARPMVDDDGGLSLLTIGNPLYTQSSAQAAGAETDAEASDVLPSGYVLEPLDGSSEECRRVRIAFDGHTVRQFEQGDATEANLREWISSSDIVHLAVHGLLDQNPEGLFSCLALARGDSTDAGGRNDGWLFLHEIYRLPLSRCELAVLSACGTNVGPETPLEAGSTLARAFLAAGARRVVSSHWNVNDRSTAELMGTFFQQVARSVREGSAVNYAQALQQARLRLRNDAENPKWATPYHWAPFVLIGPAESHRFESTAQ